MDSQNDDPTNGIQRRDFILGLAGFAGAVSALGPALGFAQQAATPAGAAASSSASAASGAAPLTSPPITTIPTAPKDNLVGVQMGPHTMCDEGIEHVLDLIQTTSAMNAMFVYSHAYGGDLKKNTSVLATDHGVPVKDQRTRNLPLVWVKQHEQYYKDTTLRHPKVDDTFDYHDRDLFAEMTEPAKKRGIKVYARILEAGPRGIVNFNKVTTVAANGRRTGTGCWNHPEYKAFWNATVEDLFKSYDLDGFQWGAERQSPFVNLLLNGNENNATCFCEFCVARGKKEGIDPERARTGFANLAAYVRSLRGPDAGRGNRSAEATASAPAIKPADGVFSGFLRILIRHPEILSWEYQYRLSREEIMKGMYDTIKKIKPSAQIGWHVDHWAVSMDPVYRAELSYAELAPWSDYLKVVMYHAVTGPRMLSYLSNMHRGIMGDVPLDELFNLQYSLFGYSKKTEPSAATAAHHGFSSQYVYDETKHAVTSAEGKTKIYPGIGFNVPLSPPDDPEEVYRSVIRAYEAGAEGFVASREYEEMTMPNLKAVGRAVRELKKA